MSLENPTAMEVLLRKQRDRANEIRKKGIAAAHALAIFNIRMIFKNANARLAPHLQVPEEELEALTDLLKNGNTEDEIPTAPLGS
jgi:hypothetical protein